MTEYHSLYYFMNSMIIDEWSATLVLFNISIFNLEKMIINKGEGFNNELTPSKASPRIQACSSACEISFEKTFQLQ